MEGSTTTNKKNKNTKPHTVTHKTGRAEVKQTTKNQEEQGQNVRKVLTRLNIRTRHDSNGKKKKKKQKYLPSFPGEESERTRDPSPREVKTSGKSKVGKKHRVKPQRSKSDNILFTERVLNRNIASWT